MIFDAYITDFSLQSLVFNTADAAKLLFTCAAVPLCKFSSLIL